jgi:spore maturation protein CgeB
MNGGAHLGGGVAMKLVVFGFEGGLPAGQVMAQEGTGIWRGLARALSRRGHRLVFLERAPTYSGAHYTVADSAGIDMHLYSDWEAVRSVAAAELDDADVGIVTSSCEDAAEAGVLLLTSRARLRCFYDVDTPATLANRETSVGERGLRDYDIVLSRMGGHALVALERVLGAPVTAALYPCVDPDLGGRVGWGHEPTAQHALSYLDPYAPDRAYGLETLLIEPARRRPGQSFLIGGVGYPESIVPATWAHNVHLVGDVAPEDRAAFYAAASVTLHVSRPSHGELGYCPSARLFEAAACGAPVLSDDWEGIDQFFAPGEEILIARDTEEALDAIGRPAAELRAIARRARVRTLDQHTAAHRAAELERILAACSRRGWPASAHVLLRDIARS